MLHPYVAWVVKPNPNNKQGLALSIGSKTVGNLCKRGQPLVSETQRFN